MAAAAMVAAGMVVTVVVVAATDTGVVGKLTHEQCLHRLVCITADTAVKPDVCICQRHLGAATDAAADQCVHTLRLQKACQRAVAVTVGVHHLGGYDLAVLYLIKLKSGSMSKMLEDLSALIGYCDFHKNHSFIQIIPALYHNRNLFATHLQLAIPNSISSLLTFPIKML